ncbi:hypothetical protein BD410DRAFT_720260 [Rickenella mellea]|uniref:Uncharacterized protein n=1 Tax=Rickenella mellea TaxID=50990 RepID=A0A4Y7Q9F8_9AGAM|nr:hypothetical protein BD410DRAFT_720260 [Rickenella mellea]
MSVALALYYFSCRLEGVEASLLDNDRRTTSTAPCNDLKNCRTASDIIWSCLTTIFACTWVAIHPNIPSPYETGFEIGLRRLGIVVLALIAPELVIGWAIRQWLVSRRLALEHQSKGWTQTHGFFALMGGFMLYSGDTALHTLSPEELDELSTDGKIMFPKITKEDIEDKSKGDVISKGFVILQTSWFVIQCIARGVEHLAITELEIVTLAFAVLNLTTYALWWNKPLNVHRPFAVQLSDESLDQAVKGEQVPSMFNRAAQGIIEAKDRHFLDWMFLPLSPFLALIEGGKFKTGAKKVPSFYSGGSGNDIWTATMASAAIAVIFGALHCIAWSFQFPSRSQEMLWRSSSLAITCRPVVLFSVFIIADYLGHYSEDHHGGVGIVAGFLAMGLRYMIAFILPIIYIAARVILLVQAFLLLHVLPPGAFQTVQWTTFIPHV